MKNHFWYLVIFICFIYARCSDKEPDLTGLDIRLFKGPAWDLAQAVERQDTLAIKQILAKGEVEVDYQEPKYGESLLLWAVWTNRYNSALALLQSGANPNLANTFNGSSPFIYSAAKFETSEYVKLLLSYDADPNFVTKNDTANTYATPLITASHYRLESVKLLLDSGAEINYSANNYLCALGASFTFKKPEITHYLLIEKGADYKKPFGKTVDGKEILITDLLRRWVFPLDSENYKIKMEIVNYLNERGVNYNVAEIPKHYYHKYPKDFLDKY